MIRGYAQREKPENALSLFYSMLCNANSGPNKLTFPFVLKACSQVRAIEEGKQVHGLVFKHGLSEDLFVQNSLISMYSSCGLIGFACQAFNKIDDPDVVSWNSMIDGYAREGRHKEILEIFKEMRVAKLEPSRFTMVSVLTACSYLGALEQGEWMQAHIEKNGIDVDSVLGTALVEMFAKCGNIERALSVFKSMEERDVGAWNSMIHKLAVHGHGQEAFSIFSDMLRSNTLPDDITFLGLLSVCRHSGLVDEGKRFFQLMSEEYGLVPKVEHYGCMVDLLCRADLLEEARDLIDSSQASQMKSSVPMWGALLGASCRLKDVAMGEYAAKHLLQLDPFDGSCYTVLSNLYSAAGLYEKAIEVRNEMKKQGLEKIPGSSSLEIDGLVLDFWVGSCSLE
ncbi:pentatricopeptide repeat-containing protein [Populus alba x Populus x berolinensis]|nr:pentatricopeptide repeat-containing protein [Populus alba x Populus x berolinensis]